jgi:hypothetical protein
MKSAYLFVLSLSFISNLPAQAQNKPNAIAEKPSRPLNLSDSALLDLVQQKNFHYFWDFGHPN